MRKAAVADYAEFAAEVLKHIKTQPVSFEVSRMTKRQWKRRRSTSRAGQRMYT